MGAKLGHISNEVVSLITLCAIITFTISTYLMAGSKNIYKFLNHRLSFLELTPVKTQQFIESQDEMPDLKNHVVVIGGDQMGQSILSALEDMDIEVVVVDFDPEILKKLESKKAHRLFGDISDLDIQERAKLDSAKLVISTNPDLEDNLLVLKELRHENRRAKVVVMAFDASEAKILYKAGADYVVLPHLAGGRQVAKLIEENNLDKIEALKNKDMKFFGFSCLTFLRLLNLLLVYPIPRLKSQEVMIRFTDSMVCESILGKLYVRIFSALIPFPTWVDLSSPIILFCFSISISQSFARRSFIAFSLF